MAQSSLQAVEDFAGTDVEHSSNRLDWRRIPLGAWITIAIPVVVLLLAILAPLVARYDPTAISLNDRLLPPHLFGAGPRHILGTDSLGRDLFSRVLYGARVSMTVGIGAVGFACLLGTSIALIAGYFGGWLDNVLMTIADIQLALPTVLLAIGVIVVLGPSVVNLILVIGISGWVTYARVVRSLVRKWKQEEFITAARALGASHTRIVFRHILPNCVPTIIVLATLDLPIAIIIEATLSFLGLGVQPPTPSWGNIIADGRLYLVTAPWIALVPCLALILLTASISHVGDRLREILDPTLSNRR